MTTRDLIEALDWSQFRRRSAFDPYIRAGNQCPIDAYGGDWRKAGGAVGLHRDGIVMGAADLDVNNRTYPATTLLRMTMRLRMLGIPDPRPLSDQYPDPFLTDRDTGDEA